MGRPAWANDEQWAWLKSQATEYLKIKGKKGETAKFWPVFLDGWKEQWPKPALTDLGRNIRSATMHPPADGNVIALRTARLAHQIGVGRMVLDLRSISETSLLRDLRGLHGVRRERPKSAPDSAMAKPARSAAATRRPRKATHTGRTG